VHKTALRQQNSHHLHRPVGLASAWKVLPGAGTGPPLPFQEHSSCDDAAERLQGALQWADATTDDPRPKNYDFLRLAGRATICRCGEAGTPRPRHGTAGKQTVAMGAGATVSPARSTISRQP
jgi:hypothetical protein